MTDNNTINTDIDNNEVQNEVSDARIILGPLVKYAAVGFVLVGIIITTAIMLDRQFNNIDREVAELQAQLAQANMETVDAADANTTAEPQVEAAPAIEVEAVQQEQATAEIAEAEMPAATAVVENNVDTTPVASLATTQEIEKEVIVSESTAIENAVGDENPVQPAVTEKVNRQPDFFDRSFDELIAERNQYLEEMDRVYLEEFKAIQERKMQYMRERLARQEQRIQEMEQRHREIMEYRAANVKEMQQMRNSFLPDRI